MRRSIVAIGAGLILALGTAAALAAAEPQTSTPATPVSSANGPEWCGFKDEMGSRVRCGYSSKADCQQAVGGPGAVCIVDPYLTENRETPLRLG